MRTNPMVPHLLVMALLSLRCAAPEGAAPPREVDSGQTLPDSLRTKYEPMDSLAFALQGRSYKVVVLKSLREASDAPPGRWQGVRPLLLLEILADGGRALVIRNDSLILCKTCGGIFGDPYAGVEFKDDSLVIHHYGGSNWRWELTHWFVKNAAGDWPLVRRSRQDYSVFEPDGTLQTDTVLPSVALTLGTVSSYE